MLQYDMTPGHAGSTLGHGPAPSRIQILVVEDDPFIVDFLKMGLEREGFSVLVASGGQAAIEQFRRHRPALILLDLKLPDLPGEEVCKRIRAESQVPIVAVTAKDQLTDRLALFQLGADDYVVKPFSFDELLARIRALLRRSNVDVDEDSMVFLDIVLRPGARQVWRGGREVKLSKKEFDLLHFFMRNPARVLPKGLILERLWGYDHEVENNIVEVYV
ncbi:MAG: response regulator transcription factor, partial [Chloroflexi bacterium]|nr:response regulator transcription factor [Chloroflexota bacterium]